MKNDQGFFAFNILLLLFISFTSVSDARKSDNEFYDSLYSLLKDGLKSANNDIQIVALAQIRALLTTDDIPAIEKFDKIIDDEMLPILVDCLRSKR
uniref:Uncharacterized protein n=1 Tax=Panagrolaimus superbus TaxID=310955 RepID=A0A914XXQ8_9BILA